MAERKLSPEVVELRISWRVAQLKLLASWTAYNIIVRRPMPWPLGKYRLWDDQGRPAW
jgi:hypothetical protein